LIDYDGMFVDAFRGKRSNELGNRNFQHIKRTADHFNHTLDRFSFILLEVAIEALINDAIAKQLNVPIDPLITKIDSLESVISSQDNKIAALEAIVVGLPVTFTSTEQLETIVDKAIEPLFTRLEALETTRQEATAPANFTRALLQRAKEVAPLMLQKVS
jgi:hypothetical protein